jgi:hypothetical protein
LIISGSSAEVGSSNSITFGFIASDRAIATRCCWPPESWPGVLLRLLGDASPSRAAPSHLLRDPLGHLAHLAGRQRDVVEHAEVGEQVEALEHHAGLAADLLDVAQMSFDSSVPSTTIRPASCSSSRLMQRIIVDLPEPDGPITTTTSCLPTRTLMSRSAWKSPKNLSTCSSSIIAAPVPPSAWRRRTDASTAGGGRVRGRSSRRSSSPTPNRRSSRWLSRLIVYDTVQNSSAANAIVSPIRPWPRKSPAAVMMVDTWSSSNRPIAMPASARVLEQADQLADLGRDHVAQRLRQHDVARLAHGLSPSAFAASICPRGTDCRPPRTISAMYAAVNRVNTTIARVDVDGVRLEGTKNPSATLASSSSTNSGAPRTSSM